MSEEIKQTVVTDANAQAKPGSEAEGARNEGDDLDSLLAQFDSTARPASTAQPPVPAAATQPDSAVLQRLQAMEGIANKFVQNEFKQQMLDTVKNVRGDMDPDVFDNDLVEAWIDGRARKDDRLVQAWLGKDANPRQWSRIQSELGREFKKRFDKVPDRAATEDREAVAAAVRGASTKAPPDAPANFGRMSNPEFRNEVREKYGFDPGV